VNFRDRKHRGSDERRDSNYPFILRSFHVFGTYVSIHSVLFVFILCSVSFIVCVVLCAVFCLIVVLFCVMCVICLLCLIVLLLPPDKIPFAVKINNNIS
jgi:hypothetical protein